MMSNDDEDDDDHGHRDSSNEHMKGCMEKSPK